MNNLKEKAAEVYLEGKITLSEAARESNLTIWEIEKYLIEKGFKSEYSLEDLEKEVDLLS